MQCLFHDNETRLLCDASPGFTYDKFGTTHLAADKIAGRLGFSTDDNAGNFSLDVPVAKPPDFGVIADLILRALFDGYDAPADKMLKFDAPFACDPVG